MPGMIPWYGWAYLALLCAIGATRFVLNWKAAHRSLSVLRLAALVVLGYGVVAFFRQQGADSVFALLLLLAVVVFAQRSFADARIAQRRQLAPAARAGIALGDAALLPAAVLGAMAVWMQRGG